jgi:hypothetical protein
MKKLLIAIAIFVMPIQNLAANEVIYSVALSEIVKCDDVLKACDEALLKAGKVIQGKNEIIDIQAKQVKVLKEQLIEAEDERDSILRSPILWFLAGIIIGGVSYGFVTK